MDQQREAIGAFWGWWDGIRAKLAAAIDAGAVDPFIESLSTQVHAISSRLSWELGAGREARYQLCVTAEGDAEGRIITERWLAAAPDSDDAWEYVAARQPHETPDLLVSIGDVELDLAEFYFAAYIDEPCEVIDLCVFHPVFAEVEADGDQRAMATFLYLEQLLGEDGVARWLGFVDIYTEPFADEAIDGQGLREVVKALQARASGEHWITLRGDVDGQPGELEANVAIKRIDHLLLDTRIELSIMLEDDIEGMPPAEEAEALRAIEAEVLGAAGEHVVLLARETHGGQRILHLHAAADGPALAAIDAVVEAHDDRAIGVDTEYDPTWEQLAAWREEIRAAREAPG
ncbi:MAG: DUF695 domain-containing protein [Myxococcales bacterium]|nr:DUF695 domain-containing protein [Myxococcales bacterium]